MNKPKKPRCPICGKAGKPILFGMPTPETMAKAERGEIVLGGCVIEKNNPSWQCAAGHKWEDTAK